MKAGMITVWGVLLGCAAVAFGQWPALPYSNRMVAGRENEQTRPKIAATPDSGCVIVWRDRWEGNYETLMQRVNAAGVLQWTVGWTISAEEQAAPLTDYDLAVDGGGNVLIAINDTRHGDDPDVTAYRITPSGQFLWGVEGIAISNNNFYEPDPRIVGTTSNNAVIAWSADRDTTMVLQLRKLSGLGQDRWNPATKTLTDTAALSHPRIVAADNDGVILLFLRHMGRDSASARHLYMQKFDVSGTPQWGAPGVIVAATDGIGPNDMLELVSDSAGGAYAYWTAAIDGSTQHVYAQHVLPNGTAAWMANGVPVSAAATEMQMNPTFVRVPGSSDVMLFYGISDLAQSTWGVGGQKLNASGEPQWGNGIAFEPLSAQPCYNLQAEPQAGGATVTYFKHVAGSEANSTLRAVRVNGTGAPVWTESPRVLSAVESAKSFLATTVNTAGQVVAVWEDWRGDEAGDVYLQNVNPAGTLGPLVPLAATVTITAPEDNAIVTHLPLAVRFSVMNFLVLPAGGDGVISVKVNGDTVQWHGLLTDVLLGGLTEGENEIVFSLVDYAHQPLSPAVTDTLRLLYQPNAVTDYPALPARLELGVYPNPFNARTEFSYDLPQAGAVRLVIVNTLGQQVATLVDESQTAGAHRVAFDGAGFSTGLYFARLEAGGDIRTQKVVLLK